MSIHPGRYDDTIQRRVVYDLTLQFKDSNDKVIDLTGWTVAAQIWDKGRTVKYADFAVTYIDRVNGLIKIALTDTQTTSLPDISYYDVLLTDTTGRKEYYLEGTFYASEGYTT
jgi:hypothetical protein